MILLKWAEERKDSEIHQLVEFNRGNWDSVRIVLQMPMSYLWLWHLVLTFNTCWEILKDDAPSTDWCITTSPTSQGHKQPVSTGFHRLPSWMNKKPLYKEPCSIPDALILIFNELQRQPSSGLLWVFPTLHSWSGAFAFRSNCTGNARNRMLVAAAKALRALLACWGFDVLYTFSFG